jgi:hypothetical protein
LTASSTVASEPAASPSELVGPVRPTSGDRLDRMLWISDQSAPSGETPENARARRTLLLSMLAREPMCYVPNPTDEQLRLITERYAARPVGEVLQREMDPNRFIAGNGAWVGNGSQNSSGQAARATLKYSFPDDGVSWRDSGNLLNSAFETRFGVGNVDRGREYIRQALASWRRIGGLSYNEVVDTNVPFSNSTSPVGGGDIRIGASTQGTSSGVLAYNFYPASGGDMAINASYLTSNSLLSSSNNYRYFRNVIAHEHGHGLGFGHPVPCTQTKLMEPFASTAFEMTQIDEIRAAQINYGDRFAGNNSAANAKDFGNLTTPILKSIIERNLSTNGASGPNGTNQDWFRFTLGSTQNVVITVAPTGGSYQNAPQSSGCNTNVSPIPTVNASQAGNLNVELKDSTGVTQLFVANTNAEGVNEVITANNLAAGTYTVRVWDSGAPNAVANQVVQTYDLTIRVGAAKAPPLAIAGVNKRIKANQTCFFMGDLNTRVNETGAVLNNASYDWDLDGDGIFETNDTPQPTRVYTSNGTINVTLRVTDSNGMSATDTILVTVGGAVPVLSAVTPSDGPLGATIPVTLTGTSLSGVTSASQVTVSGTGVAVTGTPVVSGGGTTVTGLSFVVSVAAAEGPRTVTITNADGTGQSAALPNGFSVVNTPPANDTCSAPIDWGSISGPRPFTNTGALTGTPQNFPGTGCPTSGPINNDVWYSWTAPSNGNLNVNTDSATAGTPSPFNSRVAVYSGTACPPTTLLGCDDFGVGFNVFVQFGRTYYFQVGSTNANFVGTANVILNFTPILGSCCDSSGNCTVVAANECVGGFWAGGGTDCVTFPCDPPEGTCCMPDGSCTITVADTCTGGLFAPGGTCTPNPCEQPSGSCCDTDGSCLVTDQPDCDNGRVWTLAGVCAPNPCAQPTGACCVADGSCSVTTEAGCSGTWQGVGSGCMPNNCPQPTGACCAADGTCSINTQALCSGTFQSVGSACSPNPCPQPTGACCSGTACSISTLAACSGVYQGDNSACGAIGNPTTCCPANFNLAGGVTVQDIFDFLGAYFANDPRADFNAAGGITVQDIFDYLGAYFTGCPG